MSLQGGHSINQRDKMVRLISFDPHPNEWNGLDGHFFKNKIAAPA